MACIALSLWFSLNPFAARKPGNSPVPVRQSQLSGFESLRATGRHFHNKAGDLKLHVSVILEPLSTRANFIDVCVCVCVCVCVRSTSFIFNHLRGCFTFRSILIY